ncbi:MAG: phosphoribosyltransferase family protein [bacterium]
MTIGNKRGMELFKRAGALLEGHFRLQSGKDGIHYIAKDLLWQNDYAAMGEICDSIATDFFPEDIDAVVGPESGAVKYAQFVAEALSLMDRQLVYAVKAKKCLIGEKKFFIEKDDLDLIVGKRVLIVEDVLTTGESVAKVVSLVSKLGGVVIGVGAVWNRGGVTARDLGVPLLISQITEQFPTFDPGITCPGCCAEIPYDLKWGHGKNIVYTEMILPE